MLLSQRGVLSFLLLLMRLDSLRNWTELGLFSARKVAGLRNFQLDFSAILLGLENRLFRCKLPSLLDSRFEEMELPMCYKRN